MRISKARYITEDDIKIVTLKEITKKKYDAIYKGKLFCPTEHCGAKVSFSSGRKAHYKTWRFSKHSPDCMYHFERNGKRKVYGLENNTSLIISKERKNGALLKAFNTMNKVEIDPVNLHPNSPKVRRKLKYRYHQLTFFDPKLEEPNRGKLLSRFVHEISSKDIGKIRLIKGYVKEIELYEDVAEFIVGYEDKEISISFEERFQKEPLNKSYLNKFWAALKLFQMEKEIIFTGVGEVRTNRNGKYNLSIFLGSDFKMNGKDLFNIARKMSVETLIL